MIKEKELAMVISSAREHLIDFSILTKKDYNPNWHHREIAEKLEAVERGEIKRLMVFMPPRNGKKIDNNIPVLTTNGWKKHGELKPGDYVFNINGNKTKVLDVYDDKSPCEYEIITTNGEKIKCHANHEWKVFDRKYLKWKVLETKEMIAEEWIGEKGKRGGRARFQLPFIKPIKFKKQNIEIDPYTLGIWLGDGTTCQGRLTLCPTDYEEILSNIPYKPSSIYFHKTTKVPTIYFPELHKLLKLNGLLNNKHIPNKYLYNTEKIRINLLNGLIDSDGNIDNTGRIHFSNTNKRLINEVDILVNSLGIRTCLTSEEPKLSTSGILGKKRVYVIGFSQDRILSLLKRKKVNKIPQKRKIAILQINKVKKSAGNCIQVDNKDGLYLVGKKFIPTHNSELTTIRFPAWYLGKHPNNEVITTSYSGELAERFGSQTRDIVGSRIYQAVFPRVAPDPKSQSKSFWELDTIGKKGNVISGLKKGSYSSSGIGGSITGKGANLLLIDDPFKNSEEAQSEVMRNKVWDYYTTTLYTRLEKDASIILILTRWHYDDLAGRLLAQMKKGGDFAEDWDVIEYPAIAEQDEKYRKKGEALWETKFDLATLEKIKNTVGLMNWSCLYQQNPLINELQEFKLEYFDYFKDDEIKDKPLQIDVFIDPALGERDKKNNCEVGFIVRAKIQDKPYWYILDDLSGMITPDLVVDLIFYTYTTLKKHYWNSNITFHIEFEALQKSLKYWIEEEMNKRRIYLDIQEAKNSQSNKDLRIRGLVPLYKMGVIKHRLWMKGKDLETQLVQFPQGKLKDRIDALSFGLSITDETETREEEETSEPFDPHSIL